MQGCYTNRVAYQGDEPATAIRSQPNTHVVHDSTHRPTIVRSTARQDSPTFHTPAYLQQQRVASSRGHGTLTASFEHARLLTAAAWLSCGCCVRRLAAAATRCAVGTARRCVILVAFVLLLIVVLVDNSCILVL